MAAVVLGASCMGMGSALPQSPPMAAAPHLRTGAAAPLLQRVARPDMEVRVCVRACARVRACRLACPHASPPLETSSTCHRLPRLSPVRVRARGPARRRGRSAARRLGAAARGRGAGEETRAQERRHAHGVCSPLPCSARMRSRAAPLRLTSIAVQVLLSLLYMPRAMNTCMSRMDQRTGKITRLGCGTRTDAHRRAHACTPTPPCAGR